MTNQVSEQPVFDDLDSRPWNAPRHVRGSVRNPLAQLSPAGEWAVVETPERSKNG